MSVSFSLFNASFNPTKKAWFKSVLDNKQHSTLLIGPYGKGKSHLLLMLLAALTLKNNAENDKLIGELCNKIKKVDEGVQKKVSKVYNQGKYLSVLIMSTQGDLNQAFLVGLNEALKREKLTDITHKDQSTMLNAVCCLILHLSIALKYQLMILLEYNF